MATVLGGTAGDFGISADLHSLVTSRVSTTQRVDKKEGRNKSGDPVCVAFYNTSTEVSIEGLGESSLALAATVTATGIPSGGGTFYAEEVARDYANEEFVKSSIKGTAYAGI
jgi:hypothetical protein